MRTIEATATVADDGTLTVRVPSDMPPGQLRVLLVIDARPGDEGTDFLADLPVIHVASWPADLSMRREEMYDDSGR